MSYKLLTITILVLALVACNRDPVESPAAAANDTLATNIAANADPVPTTTVTQTATPNTATMPTSDAAPAPTADIAAGQIAYKARCAGCHGADGKKVAGPVTLASAATQSKSDEELLRIVRDMGPHRGLTTDDAQARNVIAYIKALK